MIKLVLQDLQDTKKLAKIIAPYLKQQDVVFLIGNLGSGKTTFSQFLIHAITGETNIQSPTFNIVNVYEGPTSQVWHYDLYRIKNSSELFEIGLEESLSTSISIFEWPELLKNIIHNDKIVVTFRESEKNKRKVEIDFHGRFEKPTHELAKKITDALDHTQ